MQTSKFVWQPSATVGHFSKNIKLKVHCVPQQRGVVQLHFEFNVSVSNILSSRFVYKVKVISNPQKQPNSHFIGQKCFISEVWKPTDAKPENRHVGVMTADVTSRKTARQSFTMSISNKSGAEEKKEKETKEVKKKPLDDFLDVCNNADKDHMCISIFNVGQKEDIKVHNCFLAANSPVFKQMFFGPLKENEIIKIEDAEPDTFKAFVRFLHTNSLDLITEENSTDLLYLASKYCTPNLFKSCESYLVGQIRLNNLASMLNISVLFNCRHLQYKIFEFIIKNQMQLFPSKHFNNCNGQSFKFMIKSSFLAVAEDKIYNVLKIWLNKQFETNELQKNTNNQRKMILSILKHLRLFSLSRKQRYIMLKEELYSDEAKKDVTLSLKTPKFPFVPRYFSHSPRMNPFQALGFKINLLEQECLSCYVETEESKNINISGVVLKLKKKNCSLISLSEPNCPEHLETKKYLLPELRPGYYLCTFLDDGFLITQKSLVKISSQFQATEDMLSCVGIVPCNTEFRRVLADDDLILETGLEPPEPEYSKIIISSSISVNSFPVLLGLATI